MSEEDEVFLERSFQRTLIVSSAVTYPRLPDSCGPSADLAGARKAHILFGDPDCSLAPDRRGVLRQSRVLPASGTDGSGSVCAEVIRLQHLRQAVVSDTRYDIKHVT